MGQLFKIAIDWLNQVGTQKIFALKVKVVLVARRKEKLAEVKVYSAHLKGKHAFSAHTD